MSEELETASIDAYTSGRKSEAFGVYLALN